MFENLLLFFDANTPLCLAFVFALGIAVSLELHKGGPKIGVSELVSMMNHEKVMVIDVRQPKDYVSGHIDGSVNIPLAEVMENLSLIKKRELAPVLVCENGFSTQAMGEKLRDSGVSAMRLAGGIAEWRVANIPLVKGTHESAKGKGQKKHKGNKTSKARAGSAS